MIDARTACARLAIKPASLYAYVSRGLIRRIAAPGGRRRWYLAADVARVAARAAARRGHGAVAAGALAWGEPVLESAITSVEGGVLAYRGHPVAALIADGARYEQVAELLWQAEPGPWPTPRATPRAAPRRRGHPVHAMLAALPAIATADRAPRPAPVDRELARARQLSYALAAAAGARFTPGQGLAAALVRGAGTTRAGLATVEAILIAVADHELNPSTFAARIAAGTGADLYASVGAALHVFTGPHHGTMPDVVAGFVAELPSRGLGSALRARLTRGDALPGFSHRLYPDGDPRVAMVLGSLPRPSTEAARRRLAHARAVIDAGRELTGHHASLDYALVMASYALEVPSHWASTWFALGRIAGWIAHAWEQRGSGAALRPRARYVGPSVVSEPGASSSTSTAVGSGARWSDGSIR